VNRIIKMNKIMAILFVLFLTTTVFAADITITPDMEPVAAYTAVESAVSGDVVLIEPGTYQWRLYLTNDGVTIRGTDPDNRPVFDYSGRDCGNWPGSDTDQWNYWAWQIQAADVLIENIEITGARDPKWSAAIYASPLGVGSEPAGAGTIKPNITLRNVKLYGNDEGITGMGDPLIIENSEIFDNGVSATVGRHNMYIQGGKVIIRNNKIYLSTPNGSCNIQTRASETLIEGNDIGPFAGSSHSISMITDKADASNGIPFEQRLIIKNNILSGIRHHENGMSKLVSAVNSNNYVGISMFVEFFGNTFNGVPGDLGSIVGLYDSPGTVKLVADVHDNTLYNNTSIFNVEPSSFFQVTENNNTVINDGDSSVSVGLKFDWDQELVDDLDGWVLYAGNDPANLQVVGGIPYVAGMETTHQMQYTATAQTVYFALVAVDKTGNESQQVGSSIDVELEIPDPPDTTPPPVPTNFTITILP
jgi:hypothetical protein